MLAIRQKLCYSPVGYERPTFASAWIEGTKKVDAVISTTVVAARAWKTKYFDPPCDHYQNIRGKHTKRSIRNGT